MSQEMTDKSKSTNDSGRMREVEEQIRQRLLAMERENASLRSRVRILGFGLLLAFVLGAVGAFGGGIPWLGERASSVDVLTAKRIVLTDASGNARGEWRVDEEGDARLGLLDRQGRIRFSLAVLSGGSPGLSLIDPDGQRRAGLALLPDESSTLTFADGDGNPRVILGTTLGEAAQLVVADAAGYMRLALGLDEDGRGNVILPTDSIADAEEQSGGL